MTGNKYMNGNSLKPPEKSSILTVNTIGKLKNFRKICSIKKLTSPSMFKQINHGQTKIRIPIFKLGIWTKYSLTDP